MVGSRGDRKDPSGGCQRVPSPLDSVRRGGQVARMIKDNPVMKKWVAKGEERVGQLAQQLLSNETFVSAVQSVAAKSGQAKGPVDAGLRSALGAMNLPSTADVEALKTKVEDLERMLASVESKLEQLPKAKKSA